MVLGESRQRGVATVRQMPDHAATLRLYRLLGDLTAWLVRVHDLEDMLAALHAHMETLFAAPVTVLALTQPGGTWQCLTLEGQHTYRKVIPVQHDGLLERVLAGTLTHTADAVAYAEQRGLTRRRHDPVSRLRLTHAWMGAPLLLDDQPAGVLSIQSYRPGDFSDNDVELLQLLAVHLGIAIENARLRQRLEHEARTDALTHLGNRRSFVQCGEQAGHGAGPLSVAVLDVQEFKRVNDTFGHTARDAVLGVIGELLAAHAQPHGQAFRLGGDEFALLLREPLAGAHARLSALARAVEQTVWPVRFPVRLNIGLAELEPDEPFSALVGRADHEMYNAKRRAVALGALGRLERSCPAS